MSSRHEGFFEQTVSSPKKVTADEKSIITLRNSPVTVTSLHTLIMDVFIICFNVLLSEGREISMGAVVGPVGSGQEMSYLQS